MKNLEDQLTQYAAYHRDARNIATHFVGIPLIVVAVIVLLSRPAFAVGGFTASPALVAAALAAAYYLRLDRALGALMTVLLGLGVWFGVWAGAQSTSLWLALGLGSFVLGWAIQFVGHAWEGRKPAFLDDVVGLIIGPLFVVAELLFAMGFLPALRERIERRAGGIRHRATTPARPQ